MVEIFKKFVAIIEGLLALIGVSSPSTPTLDVTESPTVSIVESVAVSPEATAIVVATNAPHATSTPTPSKTPTVQEIGQQLVALKNEIAALTPTPTPTPQIIYIAITPTPVVGQVATPTPTQTPASTPTPTPTPVQTPTPTPFFAAMSPYGSSTKIAIPTRVINADGGQSSKATLRSITFEVVDIDGVKVQLGQGDSFKLWGFQANSASGGGSIAEGQILFSANPYTFDFGSGASILSGNLRPILSYIPSDPNVTQPPITFRITNVTLDEMGVTGLPVMPVAY